MPDDNGRTGGSTSREQTRAFRTPARKIILTNVAEALFLLPFLSLYRQLRAHSIHEGVDARHRMLEGRTLNCSVSRGNASKVQRELSRNC
jgi:hypothetical protein